MKEKFVLEVSIPHLEDVANDKPSPYQLVTTFTLETAELRQLVMTRISKTFQCASFRSYRQVEDDVD